MKKVILTAVLVIMTVSASFAQTRGTVMSKASDIDYGGAYGTGGDHLANTEFGLIDINFKSSTFRLREQIGLMEIKTKPCASVGVDAQYLIKTLGNLYIFPSVGLYGEYHNTDTWKDENTGEIKKWGAGVQVGGGLEYQFCPYFGIFAQGHEQFLANVANRPEVDLGIICHFGKGKRTKADEAARIQ